MPLILLLPHLWNMGIYGVLASEPVTNIVGGLACYLTMLHVVGRELRAKEKALTLSWAFLDSELYRKEDLPETGFLCTI